MSVAAKSIETARGQILDILQKNKLSWEDVAPDIDEKIWEEVRPAAKKIRRLIFQKYYPRLYAKTSRRRKN